MAQMSIDHKGQFGTNIAELLANGLYSDVTLVVNGQRFSAHKSILATRSEYFRKLFGSGMAESTQGEVTIDEPNAVAFEILLRFIYSGQLSVSNEGEILEMLRLANKYAFTALESSIVDHLKSAITVNNVLAVYGTAWLCSPTLKEKCFDFIDLQDEEVFDKNDDFATLPLDAAIELIDCTILGCHQMSLWQAVLKWVQKNGREHANPLLSRIILSELAITFLLESVRPSGLFSEAALLDAIAKHVANTGKPELGIAHVIYE